MLRVWANVWIGIENKTNQSCDLLVHMRFLFLSQAHRWTPALTFNRNSSLDCVFPHKSNIGDRCFSLTG